MAFVGRVTQNYFPQIYLEYEKKMKAKQVPTGGEQPVEAVPTTISGRLAKFGTKEFLNQFASCIVAGVAMMAYAHFSGLLQAVRNGHIEVTLTDDMNDDEESESEDEY